MSNPVDRCTIDTRDFADTFTLLEQMSAVQYLLDYSNHLLEQGDPEWVTPVTAAFNITQAHKHPAPCSCEELARYALERIRRAREEIQRRQW